MEEIKREYFNTGEIYTEKYLIKGICYREIYFYKNGQIRYECYCINGVLHREDGPALIYYDNGKIVSKYYYINGEEITDEFQIMVIESLGVKNE